MGRIANLLNRVSPPIEPLNRYSVDWYLQQWDQTGYLTGPRMTWGTNKEEPIGAEFAAIVTQAYKRNGIVSACVLARMLVFSEIRFKYRNLSDKKVFGGPGLLPLEQPGRNVTTVELLRRMEQDASLAGNWYGTNRFGGIKRLRPDWVSIVLSSEVAPEEPGFAEDAEVVGYLYGAPTSRRQPTLFAPDEIAHWSPEPDPDFQFRGMSWVTSVVREVMADNAGTDMRLKFYENGATPNLVVTAPEYVADPDKYKEWKETLESSSAGVQHAFKNLYLASGSEATPVGLNLQQLDFKSLQGGGETRVAARARVPATYLGISEGLAGSSLNQGNYAMARRQLGDGLMWPNWRDACGCLSKFTAPPAGSELWFDETEVRFLREDSKDAAEITNRQAASIRQLTDAGYVPASVIQAVTHDDLTQLEHTGLYSVQLQKPMTQIQQTPGGTPATTGGELSPDATQESNDGE